MTTKLQSIAASEPRTLWDDEPDLEELAARINEEHRACEAALTAGLNHAREAGALLLEAKRQCPHGTWLLWLREHFKGSERTAQGYMRVARRWPELQAEAQGLADLTYEGGLRLLADERPRQTASATGLIGLTDAEEKASREYLAGEGLDEDSINKLVEHERQIREIVLRTGLAWIEYRRAMLERHTLSDFYRSCEEECGTDKGTVNAFICGAQQILQRRGEAHATIALPELDGTTVWTTVSTDGRLAEISPCPDHPGYYRLAIFHELDSADGYEVYDKRGVRYTPDLLRKAFRDVHGFMPAAAWEQASDGRAIHNRERSLEIAQG